MKMNPLGRSQSGPAVLAEINVTPLVDVMLVLLIVFMISAPMMQQGIQVDLPKANSGSIDESHDPLLLVLDKNHQIAIGETLIERGTLFTKLKAIARAKPTTEIVIQADQSISYGWVAQVMGEVKRAGIQRVGLVTEPSENQTPL
jgi:biopolymer transport protein TolR